MIFRLLYLLLISVVLITCGVKPGAAEVYFIPTIHGLHKTNSNYSYNSLIAVIKRINPDVIAVELRPDDIDADSLYLSKNYPLEMRMMKSWFPGKEVEGIDWLGHDIAGKRIPENYWKEIAVIKKHEKLKSADTLFYKEAERCNELQRKRLEILKSGTLRQLIEGNDTELTRSFYICQEEVYGKSVHRRVLDFYRERDENMLTNIKKLVKSNPHKRILILAGADHFAMLRDRFPNNPVY